MATANATVKAVLNHLLENGGGSSKVVKTWQNGKNGYRVWSDGFIEQWGNLDPGANWATVSFNTPFRTTNIVVASSQYEVSANDTSGVEMSYMLSNITTTQFRVSLQSIRGVYWIAYGY